MIERVLPDLSMKDILYVSKRERERKKKEKMQ